MWIKETDSFGKKDVSTKNKNENLFLYIQLIFTAIILVVSLVLKTSEDYIYIYAKENYQEFFETDKYMENTFSYASFMEKMYNELQIRFGQLVTVFNNFSGKGSADIYPDNVSLKKYVLNQKGVLPVKGYISSPYGIRTNPFNSKQKEFHTGMDIASAKGTFILAAFDGTVSKSGYSSIAGNHIRILSDSGIETFYAHNQFNLINEGDNVLAGQIIGTVGETGYATGPHLHFEFIADGIRYNPAYILEI